MQTTGCSAIVVVIGFTTLMSRNVQQSTVLYGMVNVDLYSAILTKVSTALNTLVPIFQALSKGLIVLLCAEVVRQRVPDHGGRQWIADVVAPSYRT